MAKGLLRASESIERPWSVACSSSVAMHGWPRSASQVASDADLPPSKLRRVAADTFTTAPSSHRVSPAHSRSLRTSSPMCRGVLDMAVWSGWSRMNHSLCGRRLATPCQLCVSSTSGGVAVPVHRPLDQTDLDQRERLRLGLGMQPAHDTQQHGRLPTQSQQLPTGIGAGAHALHEVMGVALLGL